MVIIYLYTSLDVLFRSAEKLITAALIAACLERCDVIEGVGGYVTIGYVTIEKQTNAYFHVFPCWVFVVHICPQRRAIQNNDSYIIIHNTYILFNLQGAVHDH